MNALKRATTMTLAAILILSLPCLTAESQSLEELQRLAPGPIYNGILGYIYGYPLVMYGVTARTGNNVPDAFTRLGGAPINQFGKEAVLPDATFTTVVLPSTSTLYASSFINLCQEPIVLHIPDMQGRFYLLQMLDGWTEVNDKSPGSRAGSSVGDYVLVGPDCAQYKQPSIVGNFVDIIHMPTSNMWIIGRIYTDGSDGDINSVITNIYPGLTLTPWSKYKAGETYTPPDHLSTQSFGDVITAPVLQLDSMDACAFYSGLASMLLYNPAVPAQDDTAVKALKSIGVIPGTPFDCNSTLSRQQRLNLETSYSLGKAVLNNFNPTIPTRTRWTVSLDVGNYGSQFLLRAVVAKGALGANRAVDAVYGYTQVDYKGRNLNGNQKYVIHFLPKGVSQGIPPVSPHSFWSLTIYDGAGKLVPSPDASVKWNAVGIPNVQNHAPCLNSDGSLDLYLQPTAPTDAKQKCNWLPTPTTGNGAYIAFLRLYWPDQVVLDKQWIPPAIISNN